MVAGTYPRRSIRLMIGASAGSASDILARTLAPALSEQLGVPIQLELPVAGAHLTAHEPADGYTLVVCTMHSFAVAASLLPAPPYDVAKDFAPVTLAARCPLLLAVHSSVAAYTLDELTRLARAQPGALSYASSAIGGSPHLAAALYQKMTGVEMKHVCYEQTQQLFADLVAGRLSLTFNNIMSMPPLLSGGNVRGIAVTGATRSPLLPALPTMAEAGLPGYEVTNWIGFAVPAGVEPGIIATLNAAIVGALRSDKVIRQLAACGMEAVGSSAPEFADHIRNETAKWAPVVKERIARHPSNS